MAATYTLYDPFLGRVELRRLSSLRVALMVARCDLEHKIVHPVDIWDSSESKTYDVDDVLRLTRYSREGVEVLLPGLYGRKEGAA